MSTKLRELIVSIRSCKTSAEERAKIHRECASIRASFKENSLRSASMMKLMYISMLGYSTEFAQMEIVNLISHPDFGEKRIGYLTLAVLLNETHEVLTLAENYIKKDLTHTNPLVQSLALSTVANVAGEDMARDVLNEVLNLVESPNMQLKKKACLAALRIVRKVPEFSEAFLDKLHNVFSERHHGALICSLSLLVECLQMETSISMLHVFRQQIPQAVRLLKQLVLSSTAQEHDINGIADPFCQVLLMKFLKIAGQNSREASETMNDVLAQVATNTESGKNAGCAILYDCARTIFAVESDSALRVLGVNILTRFLSNQRDNNLRFVALSTLLQVFQRDPEAIQAHKATVIECLKDVDLSIRRRALELTVALIDPSNVRILVPDLIAYILTCTDDLRAEATEKVCWVIEEGSPTSEWRIEMSVRLLRMAKAPIPEVFASHFISFLIECDEVSQAEVAHNLWEEMSLPFDAAMQQRVPLLMCGMWCVGEFIGALGTKTGIGAENVVRTVARIASTTQNMTLKNYALNSIAKIAARFETAVPLAFQVFEMQATSLDCEIQQRACEYLALIGSFRELGKECLKNMPKNAPGTTSGGSVTTQSNRTTANVATRMVDDLFGEQPGSEDSMKMIFHGHKGNDLEVEFEVTGKNSGFSMCHVAARIHSLLTTIADRFQFLVAVPKATSVDVKPLNSSVLPPMGTVTQELEITQTDHGWNGILMLKIRLIYFVDGVQRIEQFQVSKQLA